MSQILKADALDEQTLQKLAAAAKGTKILGLLSDAGYVLASTGLIKAAARRIYQVTEQPSIKPLPILVHSAQAAQRWAEWTKLADALAARFWPGPLMLVLKHTTDGQVLTFPEYKTIHLTCPKQPALAKLLELSGVPWVHSPASRGAIPAPRDGAKLAETFGGSVDWLVDAGAAPEGEMTVVDATKDKPIVLREGAIKAAEINAVGALL